VLDRKSIRLWPGSTCFAITNKNNASTATRTVQGGWLRPQFPQMRISNHSNPVYKGSSIRWSVAVTSGPADTLQQPLKGNLRKAC